MKAYLVTLVGHDELKKVGQDASGQKLLVQIEEAPSKEALNELLRPVQHAIASVKISTKKDIKTHALKIGLGAVLDAIIQAHEAFNQTEAYVISGLITNATGSNHQIGFVFEHEDAMVTMIRHARYIAKLRGYDTDHFIITIDNGRDVLQAHYRGELVLMFRLVAVQPMSVTFQMARESFFGAMTDGIQR